MKEGGLPKQAVLKLMDSYLKEDLTYESGRILGSMCTTPSRFAEYVYAKHMKKNLGDGGLFPGTVKIEREAISMTGSLLSNSKALGHVVSGGTEANLLALWAARNLAKKDAPEIVVPASVHYSLDKVASLLGLRQIKVRLNKRHQVDVRAVKEVLSDRAIGIVGIAGSTELGTVDPILELSEITGNKGIYLHVDAAFGGFVLPFMKELGYDTPAFDFKLEGVSSITVDPHKMGMAPIPAGGVLFRDSEALESISFKVPYLSGGEAVHSTIIGTRPGASTIAVWALLKHLGREGYRRVVKRCMDLTHILADAISASKRLELVVEPTMNIVGIKPKFMEPLILAEKLRKRGWAISLFPHHIRVVVMPHLREDHIRSFLADIEAVA